MTERTKRATKKRHATEIAVNKKQAAADFVITNRRVGNFFDTNALLKETHDAVLILKTSVNYIWRALMGLYGMVGAIIVGAVVAHAFSK